MYILFTWFTSLTEYADDIFQVIKNFTFKDKNLAKNMTNLAEDLKEVSLPEHVAPLFASLCQSTIRILSISSQTIHNRPTPYLQPAGCSQVRFMNLICFYQTDFLYTPLSKHMITLSSKTIAIAIALVW